MEPKWCIYASVNYAAIGADNGNFCETKLQTAIQKMNLKMLSAKWQSFRIGLNVLLDH